MLENQIIILLKSCHHEIFDINSSHVSLKLFPFESFTSHPSYFLAIENESQEKS